MNTWNGHIHTGTQNVHNVRIYNIYIEHRNPETQKNTYDFLVQVRNFLLSLSLKVFRHKEREAQSFYAGFSMCSHFNTCGTPPQGHCELAKVTLLRTARLNSLIFFKSPNILRARFRCMTSITSPSSNWDFYFDISEWHFLPARAWTPALMLHLTNLCTEPKRSQPN